MNDDGPRALLDGLRVDAVGQTLLDDDGVGEVTFRLRKQIANRHGFARAAHAEQHGVLRRLIVLRAGESFDADQIIVGAVVDGLGGCQMAGERAGDGQHVGQITMFGIQFAMFVASPRPARPRLEEKIFGSAGQVALEILRRIHRVDGVLDGAGFRIQPVLRFVPNADDKQRLERDRLSLHERVNFLLLLLHDGEQRNFLFAGVVAGHAVMFLFLLVDFLGDGQRINIDRDGVVEEPQIGEPLDDAGIGRARPAGERDDGMIMAVEDKSRNRSGRCLRCAIFPLKIFDYKSLVFGTIYLFRMNFSD